MIQISNTGVTSDRDDIARLREEFRAVNCVHIPQLLHPSLLAFLQRRLEQCQWVSMSHGEIGVDHMTKDPAAVHLCHFAVNLPTFRRLMEEITGSGPFTEFRGRLYRMESSDGHYDGWHDDAMSNRLVGMSINLSPLGYKGGLFQLRKSGDKEMLFQIANTGFGDALVFKISQELQHRVSDVEGDNPKTAFAGWFRPDLPGYFEELLRNPRREA